MAAKNQNVIYPIFLPHAGCPFQCIYCNQNTVTKVPGGVPQGESFIISVKNRIAEAAECAKRIGARGEIAFYGGTFTVLESKALLSILDLTDALCRDGIFSGIRFSTRPDAVSSETCSLLRKYPISTVELGIQSLSDDVLTISRRGYTVQIVKEAAARVRSEGWSLGIQLMIGLPGDTRERFDASVSSAISLKPDFVRIYPTLVLKDTVLADWFRRGNYKPLALKKALEWCVPAYDRLLKAHIPAARLGLHSDPELEKPGAIIAGPYHPSFGYLVRVHWWRAVIDQALSVETARLAKTENSLILSVPEKSISEVIGPRRVNMLHWKKRFKTINIVVERRMDILPGFFRFQWA